MLGSLMTARRVCSYIRCGNGFVVVEIKLA
jgi:hypothetical protein